LEAPHRLLSSLKDILSTLGDRRLAVCRELTKIHEEIYRGTASQALSHFKIPKGEFTLVVEGNKEETRQQLTGEIEKKLKNLHRSGVSAKEAIAKIAAETGLSKRELYRTWLKQI
ncbi:MAG: 16S rRNA (cytidine(1402)-2'-O)-methyltransferase, partial [Dehalococcoidales bacterium]|nr:16S rRNA (cytidine(1402)-2'-O)-methyltransferase [Dehalococcoidales bacterium]